MTDTVDKVIIESELQGGDATAAGLKKVEDGLTGITVASDTTEKSTTSLDGKFASLERRFQTTQGQADQFAKIQSQVNLAVAQNPALQDRANAVLEAAAAKYTASGIAAKGAATELGHIDEISAVLESRMAGLGNSMGLIGQVLQVIGPVGLAAGVGLGALAVALNYVAEQANKFGDASIRIRTFAETTGLTATEVRGLSEAAEKVGVGGDQLKSAFERFTFSLGDVRKQTGALYDGLREIDPELADQVARTRSGAEAWDVLSKAISSTSDATTRAQLARAALNREGVAAVPVMLATDAAGGIDKYAEEVQKTTGITDELTNHTASLRAEIEATKKLTEEINASIYTEAVLNRMKIAADYWLQIAKAAKEAANQPAGATAQQRSPFVQETNRSAGIEPPTPIPQGAGGSGITADTTAITAQIAAIKEQVAATQSLSEANRQAKADEEAAANASSKMVSLLGGAATGAEKAEANFHKLSAAFLENKFGASDSADAIDKYNRALHGDTANQVAALQDQHAVITAIGGAEKMAAQEAANYNAMLRVAKDPADALVIAAQQRANAEAQVTAAAKEQLFALQNNLAVSQAVTAADQMKAQSQATLNQLLHQNVDAETASALAAAQYAEAKAKAVASAEKLVQSSNDQLETIKAQGTGMEAVVASSIAYRDAIQAGATATQAAAISANTLATGMIQAQNAANAVAQAAVDAANGTQNGILTGSSWKQFMSQHESEFAPHVMPSGDLTFSADPNISISYANGGPGFNIDTGAIAQQIAAKLNNVNIGDQFVGQGNYAGGIKAVEGLQAGLARSPLAPSINAGDQIDKVDTLTQVQNSMTSDKGVQVANLQSEMAWLNTLPETIARDQKIVSLQQSIDQLKNSTDANTAATQASLNPLYSQGHGALAIGYYKAANGLDGVAQGGTPGVDSVPIHIMAMPGEPIKVGAAAVANDNKSQPTVINNNNSFVFNNASTNNARRSQRQFAQGFGQIAAAAS